MSKKKRKKKDNFVISIAKKDVWKIGAVVVGLAVIAFIFTNGFDLSGKPPAGPGSTNPETIGGANAKVTITEYSDFQCPYCKRASTTVKKLRELYGESVEVVYKHFPLGFHKNAEIAAEASECARDQDRFWQYHDKLFESAQANGDGLNTADLKKYAGNLGLDTKKFNSCLDSGEKTQVVKKDMAEGQSKGVSGTPAFFINEQMLSGAQPIEAFIPIIDDELGYDSGVAEKIYGNEPAIELVIVNDRSCSMCDTTRMLQTSRQLFPRLKTAEVGFNSAEGKKLVREYGLEKLPSYLFSEDVVDSKSWSENQQLQNAFEKTGDKYKLSDSVTGATRFIDPQKQAAYEAELAAEKTRAAERLGITGVDAKPQIDFFVMSYCPYGNQAEEAIEQAYQKLSDNAVFQPHYVIYSNYRGGGPSYCLDEENRYCSMHGIQELDQDIRELCVYEDFGTRKFFEFALAMNRRCNSKNADTCWGDVAKDLGIDVDAVSSCEKNRGLEIVKEQLSLNKLLGVQGSPTIFVDGESYSGPRTSTGYMSALCNAFAEKPLECENIPEPAPARQAAAPSGGGCGG